MKCLNVLSDGMGKWGFEIIDSLLRITFPSTEISHNESKPPDLVVKSHFKDIENTQFNCPYITWSGESVCVKHADHALPLCELNSFDCDDPSSIYIPYIAFEHSSCNRPNVDNFTKKYCCAYAFSNCVNERESLFKQLRTIESTCYSFGSSCATNDKPFELLREEREHNKTAFKDFSFMVALENTVKTGYITEKIGNAYQSGTVPIYDSRNGIERFFNTESFFDVAMYNSSENAANAIVEVWKDKQKLQKYFDAPFRVNKNLEQYENLNYCNEIRKWMIPFVNALRDQYPDL